MTYKPVALKWITINNKIRTYTFDPNDNDGWKDITDKDDDNASS